MQPTLVGSLISAANLPHGRCLTPRYLTAPPALGVPPLGVPPLLLRLVAEAFLLMPDPAAFRWRGMGSDSLVLLADAGSFAGMLSAAATC